MNETINLSYKNRYDLNKYIAVDSCEFGNIVMNYMGITGELITFFDNDDDDRYTLIWYTNAGKKCQAVIAYDTVMSALVNKKLILTLNIVDA